jgi:catechol 2,3-dioxygenase-like lactoylglutathione lyase family enzyme
MRNVNPKFEFAGVNHLAPVCRDMKETVDFYHGVLGMPLTLTTQWGSEDREQQIFFFDIGGGSHLAFMWQRHPIEPAPGVASPAAFLEDTMGGDLTKLTKEQIAELPSAATAVGSNNHIALNIPVDKFDEYREKLIAEGVHVSEVKYWTVDKQCRPVFVEDPATSPHVFMKSVYFRDPNGIQLEFAAWTRAMQPHEAALEGLSSSETTLAGA